MSQDWRTSAAWARVRRKALLRDRFTCQVCGANGKKTEFAIHHLWDAHRNPKHRLKLDNLVTLCEPCHVDFHRWNGGTHRACTAPDFESYRLQRSRYGRAFFRLRVRHILLTVAAGTAGLIYLLRSL